MTRRLRHLLALAAAASLAAVTEEACRPNVGDRDSLLTRMEVLAVRGEPPEAKPGDTVHFSLLVASKDGVVAAPIASWAYCATPKLLTENGATSVACLADGVRAVANGPSAVDAVLPADTCALFGPEITSADLRPRDPDVTGGYYQPIRVTLAGQAGETPVAFGFERAACKLANASADAATDYAKRYVPNKNPELAPLVALRSEGDAVALDAIPAGAKVVLRASWPASSAEPFVVFDLASRAVVDRRESLRVSWYATDGSFDNDRTGRSEDEAAMTPFTDNGWIAPSAPGVTSHLFVVLRDSRGGVAFASYDLVTH